MQFPWLTDDGALFFHKNSPVETFPSLTVQYSTLEQTPNSLFSRFIGGFSLIWSPSVLHLFLLSTRRLVLQTNMGKGDKYAKLAQNKLELEVTARLQNATRDARQKKGIGALKKELEAALQNPALPKGFKPIVDATTVLMDIQNEARLRLKFFLRSVDLDQAIKTGKISTTIDSIQAAVGEAEKNDGYGKEVEMAMGMIEELRARGKLQEAAISKLKSALKATKLIGDMASSEETKERLKTFIDAAKAVGVGLWEDSYFQALRIGDPDTLRCLGFGDFI